MVESWFLILTITGAFGESPVAVAQIGPFNSKESCNIAAESWMNEHKLGHVTAGKMSAICVKR